MTGWTFVLIVLFSHYASRTSLVSVVGCWIELDTLIRFNPIERFNNVESEWHTDGRCIVPNAKRAQQHPSLRRSDVQGINNSNWLDPWSIHRCAGCTAENKTKQATNESCLKRPLQLGGSSAPLRDSIRRRTSLSASTESRLLIVSCARHWQVKLAITLAVKENALAQWSPLPSGSHSVQLVPAVYPLNVCTNIDSSSLQQIWLQLINQQKLTIRHSNQ